MSQQPPSGNLQWFQPKPDAEGNYSFAEDAQYLAATWMEGTNRWSYWAGIFEFDDCCEEWWLCDRESQIELQDIDWLVLLPNGKADPQQTPVDEPVITGRIEIDDPRVDWPATAENLEKLFAELAEGRRRAEGGK